MPLPFAPRISLSDEDREKLESLVRAGSTPRSFAFRARFPTVLEPVISSEAFGHNWARLIQKVYEVSPLACPRCKKEMRVVAVIDNIEVIRRILEHLGLWLANARPTPRAHSPPGLRPLPEDSYSQLPALEEGDYSQAPPAHWDC